MLPLCQAGNRKKPHPDKIMTYSTAADDLKHLLRLCGEDPSGFSQHSMKRGGASEAANNGAGEAEIATAGNWSQLKTARKYIDNKPANNVLLKKYLA